MISQLKRKRNDNEHDNSDSNTLINFNEVIGRTIAETQSKTDCNNIFVCFNNIVETLLQKIEELQITGIVGCMYFLTESRLLSHLAEKQIPTQIIVQKQNLWARNNRQLQTSSKASNRVNKKQRIALKLRQQYDSLTPLIANIVDPVRCLGFIKSNCLMHHKFLVLLKDNQPKFVFTGSFNMTKNASHNLENALFIADETVAMKYWNEWLNLLQYSESLDWSSRNLKAKTTITKKKFKIK